MYFSSQRPHIILKETQINFSYIYIYYFFVLFITFTKNIARIISSKLEKCIHQSKNKMVFLVRDINKICYGCTQKENGIKKK